MQARTFRPVYTDSTVPYEHTLAAALVKKYGLHHRLCKFGKDKTISSRGQGEFLSYRCRKYGSCLGDPVGPLQGKSESFSSSNNFADNDWQVAFHQTLPDHLSLYLKNGFRKLKIGEEAVIDLKAFDINNHKYRKLKKNHNKFERKSYRFEKFESPVPDNILEQMRLVSDGWLQLPGRRERTFSLGQFEQKYVRGTPVYVVYDKGTTMVAFVNRLPSFKVGETTLILCAMTICAQWHHGLHLTKTDTAVEGRRIPNA